MWGLMMGLSIPIQKPFDMTGRGQEKASDNDAAANAPCENEGPTLITSLLCVVFNE